MSVPASTVWRNSLGALALVLALSAVAAAASSSAAFQFSLGGGGAKGAGRLLNPFCDGNPYCAFNDWVNGFFFSDATRAAWMERVGPEAAHYLLTYLRDLLAGSALYYVTAGLWHLYIYVLYGDYFFKEQGFEKPSGATIRDQVQLAQASMFLYAALPVFSEWLIESGWTLCYFTVEEVGGWPYYAAFTLLYLAVVEVGIYWMHRTLHENKWLYKHVHALHHKYNKPSTLSPWASVAFNPIDGILQASPYVACLFLVPCHYLTHVVMVFFTAVWATNIHDAMDGDTEPVMGSKYHTLHHTHYHYNYGQLFIFCDWLWNTLRVPEPRATNPVFKRVGNAAAGANKATAAAAPEKMKTRKVA